MAYHYSNPARESDPTALPDIEVFYSESRGDWVDSEGEPLPAGWYYWFCFPGCLPDSGPYGPHASEDEALNAAREEGWVDE